MHKTERLLVREKLARIWSDIDHEIRPLVIELNERGHLTLDSCAGHAGFGFIMFPREDITPEARQDIEHTIHHYGIKNIRWQSQMPEPNPEWGRRPVEEEGSYYIIFPALVKPGQRLSP